MELNKLVFGGLALGCLAAAAGGGYLAARQTSPAPSAISAPSPQVPSDPATAADAPRTAVAESEGIIAPEPAAVAAPPAVAEVPPAMTPRREAAPAPARAIPAPERRVEPVAPAAPRSGGAAAPAAGRSARNEPMSRMPAESGVPVSTPNTAPAPNPNNGTMWETRPAVEPDRRPIEAEPEPAPAAPEIVELVVPADAVLGLQVERTVTSELARIEDRVEARVTRDVRVGGRVAIPAGSVVQGSVIEVDRGGKLKEKARLGIRFHTVVLADGSRLNIKTDAVVREGASPARESAAKIGGAAVGGAILGAILGGGKGAVMGGAAGAAGGTAAQMSSARNAAVLPAGTTVSVRVQQPVSVTVEK